MATHAIFALSAGTDELAVALRAGAELVAKGHDVWLYGRAPTEEQATLEGIPFHEIDAEDVAGSIEAIAEESDSVLVADLLTTASILAETEGSVERVRKLGKVLALDPWDIGAGARVIDTPLSTRTLPKDVLLTTKRLVPSFVGRGPDSFRPFPEKPSGDDAARRSRARRALGVKKSERVLLLSTTAVQLEAAHGHAPVKKLIRGVLRLLTQYLAKLENVRVLHVAPAPLDWTEGIGDRYTWVVPPGRTHLHNRFAAADAALVLDLTSSSIAWAGAWKIPAMALVNGFDVKTPQSKLDRQAFEFTDDARAWLADSTPLPRFRLCPIGLWQTLEPTEVDLPYVPLEVLDETRFLDAVRALMFDETERERALRDTASCVENVANLPTAVELWEKHAST